MLSPIPFQPVAIVLATLQLVVILIVRDIFTKPSGTEKLKRIAVILALSAWLSVLLFKGYRCHCRLKYAPLVG